MKEPHPLAELCVHNEMLQDCSYICTHDCVSTFTCVSWAEEDLGGHPVSVLAGAVGTKVWWRLEGGPGRKGHNDHRIA